MDSKKIKLPTIDFCLSELKPNSAQWISTRNKVFKSFEEFGCFEALFDKVSWEMKVDLYNELEKLFDFPLETKVKNFREESFHGYLGPNPKMQYFESLCIEDVFVPQIVQFFTQIFWQEENSNFRNLVQNYSKNLSELDQIIRRMILESLKVEKYIEEHMKSTHYPLRFSKYKAPLSIDSKIGLISHTDKNVLTILCQNQVNGLQVLTKDGHEWIDVDISPNSFIVFAADSLHAWTNGRVHSPNHRVIMSGSMERYSIGLFSTSKPGYIIEAPKELVDEEYPLLYKPFDNLDYIKFCARTEAGKKAENTLKAYAGN
ncbi:hypothetical protein K7X08_035836 [Anisodus acutangulus]|uniref:2-oxoglutarate-dependent dioxygenase DAO n=1 Tax=Anisodus acutangulus TaxID=402998 RepID=A0A9Q1QVP1_9SOLA|nr:hypothetical protein K7X08_035836 [Anisodus acutangulus]